MHSSAYQLICVRLVYDRRGIVRSLPNAQPIQADVQTSCHCSATYSNFYALGANLHSLGHRGMSMPLLQGIDTSSAAILRGKSSFLHGTDGSKDLFMICCRGPLLLQAATTSMASMNLVQDE